jgi:hypothetical protein
MNSKQGMPEPASQPKLSWEETARAMAAAAEDWSEWDVAAADGIGGLKALE